MGMSVHDDIATVAALDTEYQAAVESDDVETMDRILADDFALVTGSGKVFNKADLLEEARGDRMVYEVQRDSEQTVRVWGDTAVITALLSSKGTNEASHSSTSSVQRHVPTHSERLEVRVRPGVPPAARVLLSLRPPTGSNSLRPPTRAQ
jgi:ketosteroid isomerase-like protein